MERRVRDAWRWKAGIGKSDGYLDWLINNKANPCDEAETDEDLYTYTPAMLEDLLLHLSPQSRDIFEMYHIWHKSQKDIATIFGITQGMVSISVVRSMKILKYWAMMPEVSEDDWIDLNLVPKYRFKLKTYLETASQQLAAAYVGCCQSEIAYAKKWALDMLWQGKVRVRLEYISNKKIKLQVL